MMSFAKLFSRMWPPVARARGLTACSCAVWAMAWASVNLEAAGPVRAKNVFLVTTDGLRWQELFEGAERPLIDAEVGRVKNTNQVLKAFWRETETARREALLPFFWGTLAPRGQVWGNPKRQSHVRVTNGHNFSYPGYNEFLTGAPDSRIDSNDAKPNPNLNVFQWLNTQPGFRGRQFAAVSWGVIPWVLNAGQTGIPVWSAFPLPPGAKPLPVSAEFQELVDRVTPIWGDVSLDTFCAAVAKKAVRDRKPRAGYIALGETDDWAHDGRYDLYLESARRFDRFLQEFWELLQSMPFYRDQTALIVTTDHGRGSGPVAWKNHGRALPESAASWIAVMGPGVPALGERSQQTATAGQVAATVAALVGHDFVAASRRAAPPLSLGETR